MFRLSSISFAAALLLTLVSCKGNIGPMQSDDTLDRVRRTGEINACYVIFPPSTMKDPKTGKLSGQEYDTLNLIASKINAKVLWHETSFANMMADVQSGRCDVMPEPAFANIPRAISVAFTTPANCYFWEGALVRKSDPRFQHVKDPMEFDKPEITVVTAAGESGDIWVKEHFKYAKVKRMEPGSSDPYRFIMEVSANRTDVVIANALMTSRYAKEHPEVMDPLHGKPFGLAPTGWVVRQDDIKWLHFLETALQFLETQGTITQIEKKYNAPWMHLVKEYKLQ